MLSKTINHLPERRYNLMITDKQLTLASSSFRRVPYSTKAEANEQDNRCIFWRFNSSVG